MVYELLIIFNNGDRMAIQKVSKHGYHENMFFFEKHGHNNNFLPKENITYFGRKFDWKNQG